MTTLERLNADLKTAMKARDTERLSTLRMAISAMTYRRIDLNQELTEEEQLDVLRKQVKQRDDSIDEYTRGGRSDLADKEKRERAILATYLPAELSPDALLSAVKGAIAPLGPDVQFPAAMKAAMAALKDKAGGKFIQEAVRKVLEKPA